MLESFLSAHLSRSWSFWNSTHLNARLPCQNQKRIFVAQFHVRASKFWEMELLFRDAKFLPSRDRALLGILPSNRVREHQASACSLVFSGTITNEIGE